MADNPSIPLAATDTVVEPSGPADKLLRLWQASQQVDVDTFLATAGPLSGLQLAAVLRLDQRRRWQAGERILAESYFERYPDLHTDAEAAVDVIFQEFLLRQQLGERPHSKEYGDRFPAYADILDSQIALQSAFDDMDDSLGESRTSEQTIVFPADGNTPAAGPAVQAPSAYSFATACRHNWKFGHC